MYFYSWLVGLAFLFGVSEGLTVIAVEFGQNVTLNCSLAEKEIYWFIQRHSEPPVHILRSLGTYQFSFYNQKFKEFKEKYSLQMSSRLFIHNVTRNELGSYYCARVEDHLIFSNGTRLIRKVVASENDTRDYTREDPELCDPHYLILRMSSFVSSCILNTMLIVLVLVIKRHTKKKTAQPCEVES